MKRILYLLACLPLVAACSEPVTTSQRSVTVHHNALQITSGTLNKGRFVSVKNTKLVWEGDLKGGKQKWGKRRDALQAVLYNEAERVCGDIFFAKLKGPIFNMLDNDETMGGVAPALGVSVAIAAYIAAEAATKDTNIPSSGYMEFSCQSDEKK